MVSSQPAAAPNARDATISSRGLSRMETVSYTHLALPDLVEKAVVVQTVSDELWEQAKKLLREHHL